MHRLAATLACLLLSASASAALCVRNGADAAYVFTLETAAGTRARATLAPGAELCLTEAAGAVALPGGVAAVYERLDSIEGCSRVLGATGSDELLAYAAFDRCRWASHGN